MMNSVESSTSFFQYPSLDDIKQFIYSKQESIKSQYMNGIDSEQVNAARLFEKIQHSFSVIHEAFEKYKFVTWSIFEGEIADGLILVFYR